MCSPASVSGGASSPANVRERGHNILYIVFFDYGYHGTAKNNSPTLPVTETFTVVSFRNGINARADVNKEVDLKIFTFQSCKRSYSQP